MVRIQSMTKTRSRRFFWILCLPVYWSGGETPLKNIHRHVEFLASDELQGREAGTAPADVAARYIASEFLRIGLESWGDLQEDQKVFDQVFSVPGEPIYGPGSRIQSGDMLYEIRPLPFSASGQVTGEARSVELSVLSSGKFESSAEGKILCVSVGNDFEENPHSLGYYGLAKNAKEAGAKGIIFAMSQNPTDSSGYRRLPKIDSQIPAAWILSENCTAWGSEITLTVDLQRPMRETRNVLGFLLGKEGAQETIVVGAHYDHLGMGGESSLAPEVSQIHNGADDNASGVAAILEVAERLSPLRGKLERNVLFAAFSGEEKGLLGSAHFVKHPSQSLEAIVLMLNLDMVGRVREEHLEVSGVGTSPLLKEVVESANAGPKFKLKISEGALGYGGSDHLSFYQKDIPILNFFSGLHSDYHKPSDDVELLNLEGISRVSELVADIVCAIASQAEPLPFQRPVEPERKNEGGGFQAYLGTIPEYGDYENGVPLSGTSPGSPAEKSGMKQGDVLVRLGEVKIANIYDFVHALKQYRPGDQIEVEWVREGKSMVEKITLGRR